MSDAPPSTPGAGARARYAALALGAIGVVYGDIGTSPLYAIKQTFGAEGVPPTEENVLGILSLMFWSLILVVSVKYAGFIMRADNKGEGGIMALTALAQRSVRSSQRARWWIIVLGLFGASLFFGDGVITPAISVLGAVEGLEVVAPHLDHFVVPIAAVIVLILFAFQNRGTGRVGAVFAPVMSLWFVVLAVLGVWHIAEHPGVLRALSPYYAIEFFMHDRRPDEWNQWAEVVGRNPRKSRFVGMHYSNPVTTMRMCEVIYTPETGEDTIEIARQLAEASGKAVSMVKDAPGTYGFLLNRIFGAAYREANAIVEAGIATKEDIDKAMITGRNWPSGFFGGRGGIGKEW